jgi:hypothetical protein
VDDPKKDKGVEYPEGPPPLVVPVGVLEDMDVQ